MPRKGTLHIEFNDKAGTSVLTEDLETLWLNPSYRYRIMDASLIYFVEEKTGKSTTLKDRDGYSALVSPLDMKMLLLPVGLPRSGKSTWAKQSGFPIVNPDSVRLALHGQAFFAKAEGFVWAISYLMVDALFMAGHQTVVVDATNISDRRRQEWTKRFASKDCVVRQHVFKTSPAVCVARAKADKREDLIPVIERMSKEWDLPVPEEWCNAEREGGQCTGPYRCLHSPSETT